VGEWIGIRAEVDHVVTFARGASATSAPAPGVAQHTAEHAASPAA
jgi:iron(III) transport system ATP-binding protein